MDDCTRKMIQVAVAQTCLNVGWSTIHSSPLEILTDLLSDYILGLCKRTNNYAYLFNQTEPNLDHLGLAFMDLGVSLPELEEYVNYFDNNNCPDVARYPIPKESSLNFLKPGSREVVTRPVHIHEHLPPMYPHLEEQDTAGASKVPGASSPPEVETASAAGAEASASVSPGSGLKRRGDTPAMESFTIRRARALAEEETRQLREISSVMMTTSGFLSHAREGKLPEVRTIIPEPEPEEQPPPPQPPAQPTEPKVEPLPPPPDVKPEKKKKKKSHDPSKKVEKDKVKDDQLPSSSSILTPSILSGLGAKSSNSNLIPDDSQIKKLTTVKETNKLKALKPGATKAIAITPNSFTPTPKSEKKHKPKRPNSPAAAMAGLSPLGVPKAKIPKIDKFQMKERIVVDDAASDTFPDIKLTAEPDKQKLNIFKKISKVKEDHDEIKMEVDSHHLGVKLGKDVTVELVPVETPKKPLIPPSEIKEEKVDVVVDEENFHSPTAIGLVSFVDEIMPGTPTTPKTPDIPKIPSDHKKKKREKHKEKKERDKYVSSPVSSRTIIDDSILSKPKTPEVIVDAPDDHYPPFSFLGYPTGPTIIPPNLASNPLIPQIRVPDAFGPRIPHPPLASLAHPPPQKEVATPTTSASVSTTSSAPVTPSTTTPTESPVTPIKKKEKKDKKNKDKVKKKKDKKEKAKSKEKSEKKKQKLMKKQKLEDKIKLKKEKKDKKKETQNHEEKRGDSPSVPKITFKLGPDPQREQSPNPKITFKPIVKKEEEVGDVPKKHASDLPQTSTPVTKHHKGSSSKSSKSGAALDLSGHQKLHDAPPPTKAVAPLIVHAPTVPKVEPETSESNQLWICPACGRPDDGSPMIACDACDMWYHYVCVGIQEAPESDWFCQGCISKKPDLTDKKKKHKKKK